MVSALVHRAVAHETERAAFQTFVFEPVSESQPERCLTADDSVSAPVVFVGSEKVHRSALATRATGGFSKKFCHAFIHAHSHSEGVSVVAVGRDDMVVFTHERNGSHGYRLLPDIEVEESTHHALVVILE